jgi:hypothetical protein
MDERRVTARCFRAFDRKDTTTQLRARKPRMLVTEGQGRGRKAPMVQREVAVVIAGRGLPSETHTLGLDWDWCLMKP